MQEIIAALVAFFILDPLKADISERLAATRAPQALVRELAACAQRETPTVVARLAQDPWWGVTTVVRVWAGLTPLDAVLQETAPGCRPALEAARPFLSRGSGSF